MNQIERKMLDTLKELRDEHGVLAVKAEFEAEGSRTDELVKLNEIVFRADMNLCIKIGGCEAVRDLDQCRLLGASGIMAPMIETPFAMKKFVGAAKKVYGDDVDDIEWIINAETKTCVSIFDEILHEGRSFLDTVCIGRSDLSASMGIKKDLVDCDEIFNVTQTIAKKARSCGLSVRFGGNISVDSIDFIKNMKGLVDAFETRKVIFNYNDEEEKILRGISKALEFEMLYIQNKCDFYDRMANEDQSRLISLKKRLGY